MPSFFITKYADKPSTGRTDTIDSPADDSLIDIEEVQALGRAIIFRAWADAGLADDAPQRAYGLDAAGERDAIRFLTDRDGAWKFSRAIVADMADIGLDYLHEKAVKKLGGLEAVAARLASLQRQITASLSTTPEAVAARERHDARYAVMRAGRIARGLPVRPRARPEELAATVAENRSRPEAFAQKNQIAPASP